MPHSPHTILLALSQSVASPLLSLVLAICAPCAVLCFTHNFCVTIEILAIRMQNIHGLSWDLYFAIKPHIPWANKAPPLHLSTSLTLSPSHRKGKVHFSWKWLYMIICVGPYKRTVRDGTLGRLLNVSHYWASYFYGWFSRKLETRMALLTNDFWSLKIKMWIYHLIRLSLLIKFHIHF